MFYIECLVQGKGVFLDSIGMGLFLGMLNGFVVVLGGLQQVVYKCVSVFYLVFEGFQYMCFGYEFDGIV